MNLSSSKINWVFVGAVLGGFSVALGAFGAHALSARLSEKMMSVYQTGTQYQMAHALALLAVGVAAERSTGAATRLDLVGWAFTLGCILFSGSLYLLALTGIRWLGLITPLGGVCFLAGWFLLAFKG